MVNSTFSETARAIVQVEQSLLVMREPRARHVFTPGGHILPGEAPHTALSRELNEELPAYRWDVSTYLGQISVGYRKGNGIHHIINHFFEASARGLTVDTPPRPSEGHLECLWAPIALLPLLGVEPCCLSQLLVPRLPHSNYPWKIEESSLRRMSFG